MKQEHMMEAMNHIDPALVEGADRCGGEARRGKWRKPALIAACLCLALAGTALAAELAGVRIAWTGSDSEDWLKENGVAYTVENELAYFPLDSFSEEVTALSSEVQDKTVSWPFASWDALEEYLGRNVLDNLTLEEAARGPDITFQGSRGKRTNILLMAHFNEQGLVCVTAKSNHLIDGIQIGTGAQLYTELMRASVEARGGQDPGLVTANEGEEFSFVEAYTAAGGVEATITQKIDAGSGIKETYAYYAHFNVNGVGFHVTAECYPVDYTPETLPDDPVHTLSVLKEVLDGFVFEPAA